MLEIIILTIFAALTFSAYINVRLSKKLKEEREQYRKLAADYLKLGTEYCHYLDKEEQFWTQATTKVKELAS